MANYALSEEQLLLEKQVEDFAKAELNNDSEDFNLELWKKCADFGILGICMEEKYGGLGESYLTAAMVMKALGYACNNSGFVFAISNHLWVCANLIQLFGNERQKERYIPPLINGSSIGGFALTESDSGSDALSMKTYAEKVEGGYVINGSKMFISNGPIADLFVVIVRTGKRKQINGYTAFIIPSNTQGFKVGKTIEKMGLKACPMSELTFDNCFVPDENILGNPGVGSINSAMEWERCFEFASHIGAMRRMMEESIAYAESRIQFDQKISVNQSVSNKIADMRVSIEMSENLLYKIATMKDLKKNAFLEASILKLYVSENYVKTCMNAVQIMGAYGYTKEYMAERELRDAIGSTIYSGTSEIQRKIIYQLTERGVKKP